MKLTILIDRYLPQKLKENQILYSRAKITCGVLIFNIVFILMTLASLVIFRIIPTGRVGRSPIYFLIQLIFYLILLLTVMKSGRIKLANNIFILSNFTIIAFVSLYYQDSIAEFTLYILPAVAILAFTLLGMKGGLIWTILFGVFHSFVFLNQENFDFLNVMDRLSIISASYVIILISGSIYEYNNFKLMDQLEFERSHYKDKAHKDKLTKIANRHHFELFLDRAIVKADNTDESFALAYMDLNGFKPINDKYGHKAGDIVLVTIAGRMEHTVRNTDLVARLGGDEFAIIFQNLHERERAKIAVEHVLNAIREPITIDNGVEITVSGSFGVVVYQSYIAGREELIHLADQEMYKAKKNKNHISFFEKSVL